MKRRMICPGLPVAKQSYARRTNVTFRACGTGPVGPAKTRPLSSTNSVMIVAFINALWMSSEMIATIS